MRTQLNSDQIHSYRENGFLHVPGFLSSQEVTELKQAMLDAVASMGKRKVAGGGPEITEGDAYYDRVFTQRLNLWRISPVVKRYMLDAQLGKMLCDLAGIKAIRVWHDQALIKEPFANPTAWHLDVPFWSFYSREAISI